jgi:hypothetical protein
MRRALGVRSARFDALSLAIIPEERDRELVTELVSRHLVVTGYRVLSDLLLSCNPRFGPKNAL